MTKKALPAFMRAMRAVAEAEGLSVYEKSTINAAIQWVDFETGRLWPSRKSWAEAAGFSERWHHTIVKGLIGKGIIRLHEGSKGGRGKTVVWEIELLAVDKPCTKGADIPPEETLHETMNETLQVLLNPARNPANDEAKPCKSDTNPANQPLNPAHSVQTNSEQPLEQRKTERVNTHASAETFSNDRAIRTGNVPPGFAEFIAAYPGFRAKNRAAILGEWNRRDCERNADAVLAGLEKWRACDEWALEGVVPNATKFLEDEHWKIAPPPKRVVRTFGGGAF